MDQPNPAAAVAAALNDALADLDVANLVFANDAANAALTAVNNANLNVANARNASALADAALGDVNAVLDNADAVNSALAAAAAAAAAAALTAADAALIAANAALTAANADAANAAAVAVANAAAANAGAPRAVASVVVDAARVISIKDIAAVTTATASLHAAEADAAAAPPDVVADARVIVNTTAAQLRAAKNAAAASALVANLDGVDVAPLTPVAAIHAVIAAAADLDAVNAAAPPPQTARRASVFAARIIAKLTQVRPDVGNRHAYDQFGDADGGGNGYAPAMFSIGPHHRNVGNLKYMEMHKWHCLNGMLEADLVRRYLLVKTCYDVLSGLEGLAREYYGGCIIDLGQHDFLEMLLLDGCFLISTFLKLHSQANPFLNSSWIHSVLQTDLLCLENQLPFSVVENLHRVIMTPNHEDQPFLLLMHAVKWSTISNFVALPAAAFRNFASIEYGITRALGGRLEQRLRTTDENLRRIREQHGINIDPETVTQIDLAKLGNTAHFLHLSYKLLLSEDLLATAQGDNQNSPVQPQGVPPRAYLLDPTSLNTYSTTELNNAGVKFKCVGGRKFYDIRFINKTLEIPEIYISKGLKARLLNLLAYEARCRQGYSGQILGDYITFMDSLINTAKDVELLRKNGIIKYSLGSDEAVAILFNEVGAIAVRSKLFRYSDIVGQLKEHCGNWWNIQRATLKSRYFSNTWSIASFAAAILLLLLTAIQTICSVGSYFKGP